MDARPDVGTADWWFAKLLALFDEPLVAEGQTTDPRWLTRRERLDQLWHYYDGDPPLPEVSEKYKAAFRAEMRRSRSNYAELIVNAVADRMNWVGAATKVDSSVDGDDVAAQIAHDSGLTREFKDYLSFVFALSEGFLVVDRAAGSPRIRSVDPRRCVGITDPDHPARLRAALELRFDPVLVAWEAHLYLPGVKMVYRQRSGAFTGSPALISPALGWERDPDRIESFADLDDLGGMPILRYVNKDGRGEFEKHLDLIDRINDTTLQRLVLIHYQAFRQRALKSDFEGVRRSAQDAGKSVEEYLQDTFSADPGALWTVPAGTEFWESGQADLTPILNAKRDDVRELAVVSTTPLHLITPDAANGSAEGATTIREGHLFKIRDRRDRMAPVLEDAMRIALRLAGHPDRAERVRILWGPTEARPLEARADAAVKLRGILSMERILTDVLDLTPTDARDVLDQLAEEKLMLMNSPTPAAGVTSGGSGDQ